MLAMLITSLLVTGDAPALSWEPWPHFAGSRCAIVAPRAGAASDSRPPVLLLFCDGRGDCAEVEATLSAEFRARAAELECIVVAPAADEKAPDPAPDLATLVRQVVGRFEPQGGRIFVAGNVHGVDSALAAALAAPENVRQLTFVGMRPGGLDAESAPEQLAGLPMVWTRADAEAFARAQAQADALDARGVHLDVRFSPRSDWATTAPFAIGCLDAIQREKLLDKLRTRAEKTVAAALDDFHQAASVADGARYFGRFTRDAVFLGTAPEERWSVAQFRAYAEPYFSKGKGWTYVATERHVTVDPSLAVAWFDERLQNAKYGEVRGSGVLRRVGGEWKIAQYNLAFQVPNEATDALMQILKK